MGQAFANDDRNRMPARSKAPARGRKAARRAEPCRGRVLVLDDDEYIRAVLSDMLGNDGYEVSAAESGEAAVEGFRKAHELHQPVDVVVLDLRIPEGMQGNDVLELIRSIDGSIKAVALTGDINHPVVARYREYGFQGVLLKPFLSAELVQAIEEARV